MLTAPPKRRGQRAVQHQPEVPRPASAPRWRCNCHRRTVRIGLLRTPRPAFIAPRPRKAARIIAFRDNAVNALRCNIEPFALSAASSAAGRAGRGSSSATTTLPLPLRPARIWTVVPSRSEASSSRRARSRSPRGLRRAAGPRSQAAAPAPRSRAPRGRFAATRLRELDLARAGEREQRARVAHVERALHQHLLHRRARARAAAAGWSSRCASGPRRRRPARASCPNSSTRRCRPAASSSGFRSSRWMFSISAMRERRVVGHFAHQRRDLVEPRHAAPRASGARRR